MGIAGRLPVGCMSLAGDTDPSWHRHCPIAEILWDEFPTGRCPFTGNLPLLPEGLNLMCQIWLFCCGWNHILTADLWIMIS